MLCNLYFFFIDSLFFLIIPHNIYIMVANNCFGIYAWWFSRAYVEVKPILYVEDGADVEIETTTKGSCSKTSCYWGFKQESWHDSCIQKCVIPGKICVIILSITSELAAKISNESLPADYVNNNDQHSLPKSRMEQLSKFCIYLLDKVIIDSDFAWEDIMVSIFFRISHTELILFLHCFDHIFYSCLQNDFSLITSTLDCTFFLNHFVWS
jgi:hypothetical protein